MEDTNSIGRGKPHWLRRRLPSGPEYEEVRQLLRRGRLHTVCQEAACPNQFECFSNKTATFLILGSKCTRNCRFCNIEHASSLPAPDLQEPIRVADAAVLLQLRYVVITSVTRDDLPDGGAGHFAAVIEEIRRRDQKVKIEVLIPDFRGDPRALKALLAAGPDVLNHNIETVPRIYPRVRPEADYRRSLALLKSVADFDPHIPIKSGLMLGLGETTEEVHQTLCDLFESGCRFLTVGQYLQPTANHLPVERFVPPDEFDALSERARAIGFEVAACGPFVRSSYHAREMYRCHADGSRCMQQDT